MQFISGSCDGEVRIWDLPSQKTVFNVQAHSRFVRGLVCDPSGKTFYTCSDDKTIKRFKLAMDISDVFPLLPLFIYSKVFEAMTIIQNLSMFGMERKVLSKSWC